MTPISLAQSFMRLAGQYQHASRLLDLINPAIPHILAFIDEPVLEHATRAGALLDPNSKEIVTLLVLLRGALTSDAEPWTVARYQLFLKDRGFYTGRVDGDPQGLTRAAVRAYQAHHGLAIDGEVGPATTAIMLSEGA